MAPHPSTLVPTPRTWPRTRPCMTAACRLRRVLAALRIRCRRRLLASGIGSASTMARMPQPRSAWFGFQVPGRGSWAARAGDTLEGPGPGPTSTPSPQPRGTGLGGGYARRLACTRAHVVAGPSRPRRGDPPGREQVELELLQRLQTRGGQLSPTPTATHADGGRVAAVAGLLAARAAAPNDSGLVAVDLVAGHAPSAAILGRAEPGVVGPTEDARRLDGVAGRRSGLRLYGRLSSGIRRALGDCLQTCPSFTHGGGATPTSSHACLGSLRRLRARGASPSCSTPARRTASSLLASLRRLASLPLVSRAPRRSRRLPRGARWGLQRRC
jgi:hypothetical protein